MATVAIRRAATASRNGNGTSRLRSCHDDGCRQVEQRGRLLAANTRTIMKGSVSKKLWVCRSPA
jgi:hypothetical protein